MSLLLAFVERNPLLTLALLVLFTGCAEGIISAWRRS